MIKKTDTILKEYTKKLSDDILLELNAKISQNLCGDMASVADILSQDKAVDYMLSTASSSDEWYSLIDMLAEVLKKEGQKRGLIDK